MKTIFFNFFFISSFFCFSQEISGVATYGVKTNYTFKNIENEQEKEVLKKIFNKLDVVDERKFELLFINDESIFQGQKGIVADNSRVDFANILARITGTIYANTKTKEIIQTKEKFDKTFRIIKSIDSLKWVLTNEKIKLGNYICYKAILNKEAHKKNETIAWYTMEIPINIGPKGYCGLPGFIVLLQDDIFIYSLEKINFNLSKKQKGKIFKPTNGLEVSLKQYDSIYKVMRKRKDLIERERY